MNISGTNSDAFKKDNKNFFETKIKPYQSYKDGATRNVIDLNQNDKVDAISFNSPGTILDPIIKTDRINEPTLSESYKKIKDFARAQEKEVITQDDLALHVKDLSVEVTYDSPVQEREIGVNLRSLSEVIKDASPFTPNAQWALDVKNDTFMVFEPKKEE
jgi:hypothetical protein